MGRDKRFAQWSHAALVVNQHGMLVESIMRGGVKETPLSYYERAPYLYINTGASPANRLAMAETAVAHVGEPYGFLRMFSLALNLIHESTRFQFGSEGSWVCSDLAAVVLAAGGIDLGDPHMVYPADVAEYATAN